MPGSSLLRRWKERLAVRLVAYAFGATAFSVLLWLVLQRSKGRRRKASGELVLIDSFETAVAAVSKARGLSDEDKLELYALYKQATVGPCDIEKPSMLDIYATAKWEAWRELGKLSVKQAQDKYMELARTLLGGLDLERGANMSGLPRNLSFGQGVSRLADPEGDETQPLLESEKTLVDFAAAGNLHTMRRLLESGSVSVNTVDSQEGKTALHMAVDRGLPDVANFLLERKANVNAADLEGQTPLHYACVCDHDALARLLLKYGANPNLEDNEGETPRDVCESASLLAVME
eukprot:gb/GEZN01012683.1/.p1 GENE.gb/GEZN01012683.1/~~gb/GEZN01012683.1/.p1  ORF type:complete len:291 (-),score=52.68 gb/GEZN01012683.1/:120-992(-)